MPDFLVYGSFCRLKKRAMLQKKMCPLQFYPPAREQHPHYHRCTKKRRYRIERQNASAAGHNSKNIARQRHTRAYQNAHWQYVVMV